MSNTSASSEDEATSSARYPPIGISAGRIDLQSSILLDVFDNLSQLINKSKQGQINEIRNLADKLQAMTNVLIKRDSAFEDKLIKHCNEISNKFECIDCNLKSLMPKKKKPETNEQRKIQQWLTEVVKLPQYYSNFINNGFVSLDTIRDVNKQELSQIGINLIGHQKEIIRHGKAYQNQHNASNKSLQINKETIISIINCFQPLSTTKLLNQYYNKCQRLRKFVESKFDEDDIMILDEAQQKYKTRILEFIECKDNVKDPIIHNYTFSIPVCSRQSAIIQVFDIVNHPRISELNGQKGLRAKVMIGRGTVIGEYDARYIFDNDLDTLHGTKLFNEINKFAFNATVTVDITMKQLQEFQSDVPKLEKFGDDISDEVNFELPLKRRRLNNNHNRPRSIIQDDNDSDDESLEEDLIHHEFNIALDGYSFTPKCKLLYMNDCRKDLSLSYPTNDDKKFINIEFVTAYIRGWPRIFAVTTKSIKSGAELFAHYGEYTQVMREEKRLKKRDVKLLEILRPLGLQHIVGSLN